MCITAISFLNRKNDCVKAFINSQVMPNNIKMFWVFEKSLDLPVPDNVTGIHYEMKSDNTLNTLLDAFRWIFVNSKCESIISISPDTILYRPECFIRPIYDSNADIVYVRNNPPNENGKLTNICCYSISGRGMRYLNSLNTDEAVKNSNVDNDNLICNYMTNDNPWPLVSQIDSKLVAFNDHIEFPKLTIAGKYDKLSNNEMLKRVNEVLEKQGRPALDLTDKMDYFNKLKN